MSKLPMLDPMDRRLNIFDENGNPVLDGGKPASIKVAFTELRAEANYHSQIDTQLIFGEDVLVYQTSGEWSHVQAVNDRYAGWLETSTLRYDEPPATHLVCAPRTFFYPEPDLKLPHKGMRSMGSGLRVIGETENRGTNYALLESGEAIIAKHIRPIDAHDADYVNVAERLVATPYLWAGTSAFGIDCSGFVKLTMFMTGRNVLRDSDMQAATIGEEIDPGENFENIQRGDLVFWRGHVGIAQGEDRLIHANGHSMDVTSEPLMEAIERIAYLYEMPIGVRRP